MNTRRSAVLRSLARLAGALVLAAVAVDAGSGQPGQAGKPGSMDEPMLLTDFHTATDLGWFSVNDGVMGGRSTGGFRIEDGVLLFSGATNTNGGGFASIRTQPRLPSLAGRSAVLVHAQGDGRRYVLRLESDDGEAYWADFTPAVDGPGRIRVPLDAFRPRYRGRWLSGPPLDAARIVALGFMCYDGRDGPFRLMVHRIEAE